MRTTTIDLLSYCLVTGVSTFKKWNKKKKRANVIWSLGLKGSLKYVCLFIVCCFIRNFYFFFISKKEKKKKKTEREKSAVYLLLFFPFSWIMLCLMCMSEKQCKENRTAFCFINCMAGKRDRQKKKIESTIKPSI